MRPDVIPDYRRMSTALVGAGINPGNANSARDGHGEVIALFERAEKQWQAGPLE